MKGRLEPLRGLCRAAAGLERLLTPAAIPPPQPLCPGGSGGQGASPKGGESLLNRRGPHRASGRALRAPSLIPGGQRPRRTPVTAASSPLFTSVFSTLITRFIAFARGKPGDGGAGEDPPRQPPHCPGEGRPQSSAGAAPTSTGFRQDLGRGGAEPGSGACRGTEGAAPQPALEGRLQRLARTPSPPAEGGEKSDRIDGFSDKQRR